MMILAIIILVLLIGGAVALGAREDNKKINSEKKY